MQRLEITKMLTISTANVSRETADLINENCDEDWGQNFPTCYTKGLYGYLIYVSPNFIDEDEDGVPHCTYDIPEDLFNCMSLAYERDCQWLCLDRDGAVVKDLPVFDW